MTCKPRLMPGIYGSRWTAEERQAGISVDREVGQIVSLCPDVALQHALKNTWRSHCDAEPKRVSRIEL
jgi:hypothetical protein